MAESDAMTPDITPMSQIAGWACIITAAVFMWIGFLSWFAGDRDGVYTGGLLLTVFVVGVVLLLAGCGESTQRADLPPATIGIPIGHTPSSRTYAAWCGATCRCNVTVNQDCAEDATWLAEGTPPMPAAPFQPPNSVTPKECN